MKLGLQNSSDVPHDGTVTLDSHMLRDLSHTWNSLEKPLLDLVKGTPFVPFC